MQKKQLECPAVGQETAVVLWGSSTSTATTAQQQEQVALMRCLRSIFQ